MEVVAGVASVLFFYILERVKSLCVENQIWRDLAQANEATANALSTNLKQVLAQVSKDDRPRRRRQSTLRSPLLRRSSSGRSPAITDEAH